MEAGVLEPSAHHEEHHQGAEKGWRPHLSPQCPLDSETIFEADLMLSRFRKLEQRDEWKDCSSASH